MKRSYKSVSGGYKRRGAPSKRRRVVRRGAWSHLQGLPASAVSAGRGKYKDTVISISMNIAGSQTLLNGLHSGNTADRRIGMKVSIRSIELRGYTYATPGTGGDQIHRALLLVDKQANAGAPTLLTDYLDPATVNGMRNLANRKRFKNIWDRSWISMHLGSLGLLGIFMCISSCAGLWWLSSTRLIMAM